MKNKLIGIFVCTLLIATAIPAVGLVNETSISEDTNNKINPSSNDDKWMKTFGGKEQDFGSSVQQTSDGGYIVFGVTESYGAGSEDFWLIKTDSDGNKIWDKTYGGEESDDVSFGRQTIDGGYIIVGHTYSFDVVKADIWLVKTDNLGNKVWDKTFGGTGYETASEVWQTNDGGYVVFGYTDSFGAGVRDMWLIKTDSEGNMLWDKTYGGDNDDRGESVKQTSDGGYILAGETRTSETTYKFDVRLIKTDNSGEIIWDQTYGGSEHKTACSVQQTSDGGYIICGEIEVGGLNEDDIWLLKTDSEGELSWEKIFGGHFSDRGHSVQQTTDGGYVIAGDTFAGTKVDGLLIKTDSNGEKEWSKTYGGLYTDITVHVQQTNDGGYILTGYYLQRMFQYRDLWLIKTDENGDVPRSRAINTPFLNFLQNYLDWFPILRLLYQRLGLQ